MFSLKQLGPWLRITNFQKKAAFQPSIGRVCGGSGTSCRTTCYPQSKFCWCTPQVPGKIKIYIPILVWISRCFLGQILVASGISPARARLNWHSYKWKNWSEHNKLRCGLGWEGQVWKAWCSKSETNTCVLSTRKKDSTVKIGDL
jgi:hypothetical protein